MKPMTQAEDQQKMMLLHTLKGAPTDVIMALICYGRLNGRELCDKTGYSKNTIGEAIRKLSSFNMVYQVDQFRGWKLGHGIKQLSPILTALLGSESGGVIEAETGRSSQNLGTSSLSSSRSNNYGSREEEERKQPEDRKISDLRSRPVDNPVDNSQDTAEIKRLLIDVGIGRNSPKLRQILDGRPDPNYIRAHTNYYRWWQSQRKQDPRARTIDGRTRFTAGTLITRILQGDQAPPLRCLKCGRLESNCVCNIIER